MKLVQAIEKWTSHTPGTPSGRGDGLRWWHRSGVLLVIRAVPSVEVCFFPSPSEMDRIEMWSSDGVRQRPRLGVGEGVGVAGRRLALLSPSSGLADGVAAVFRQFAKHSFLSPVIVFRPSLTSSPDTRCQEVSEMGLWDASKLKRDLFHLTSRESPLHEPKAYNIASATHSLCARDVQDMRPSP